MNHKAEKSLKGDPGLEVGGQTGQVMALALHRALPSFTVCPRLMCQEKQQKEGRKNVCVEVNTKGPYLS